MTTLLSDMAVEAPFPTLNLDAIDRHFPKDSYREGQREAIEFVLNSFNSGKQIVILEGPTGSGKSAIGMTVANMVKNTYYLTITKILQDQLVTDFGSRIVDLKGRNAYPCTFYQRIGPRMVQNMIWSQDELDEFLLKDPDCSNGYCRTKHNSKAAQSYKCDKCFLETGIENTGRPKGDLKILPQGMRFSACPYYEQVHKALRARIAVMNFSSFLFQTTMTKRFEDPRQLMIVDECHNLEPQLLDFVSFTINDVHLQKHGIFIPDLEHPYEYAVWFEDTNVASLLLESIKKAREDDKPRVEDELARVLKKYKMFMDHILNADEEGASEWVCEYEEKRNTKGIITHRSVTLKPVFAYRFVNNLLFKHSKRVLMMSATVLDVNVMCRSLGIKRDQVAAMRMKNRFPVKNRLIHVQPVAKMTGGKDKMAEWAPKLVEGVNEIVEKYRGKRGIIHTHNFRIMDHLLQRCDPAVKRRFLNQKNFRDKKLLLEAHAQQPGAIIVAPAMHEGIDLAGDLSRFQIICKIPYANCFDDEQLARRVEIDRRYYIWLTALRLVQSYGRSIRSESDYADTYILDEAIYRFMRDAKTMIPTWFSEAIRDINGEL